MYHPVREELRRALAELRGQQLSPKSGAAAVALGLFVGTLPIFGFHLAVVLALCLWLRLDTLVAYLAANISNPLVAPFLVAAELEIGAHVRTGAGVPVGHAVSISRTFAIAADLLFGAPILALSLAALGYGATYGTLRVGLRWLPRVASRAPYHLPSNAPPWVMAVERVAARYAPAGGGAAPERSRFHYVRMKLLGDPVARMIADLGGEEPEALGAVLDVGTGRGQLPVLLLELRRARSASGIDWDETKIRAARRAVAASPAHPHIDATFTVADARVAEMPASDTVLLIDVLHYFGTEEQGRVLRRAAAAVRSGGRLVVREADTERGLRSCITRLEEALFSGIGFNRGEQLFFRPVRELSAQLEDLGFACDVRPAWGRTPFSNMLLVARRP
jgi:uncharacterized protein (DUF2062 family)/precorrin-6B methylase 2